ncbi:MAG: ECF transporter S component [Dehalococcoidia bacterium]
MGKPSFSTWLPFVALNVTGLVAYLYPFFVSGTTQPDARWFEHAGDAPLIFGALGALCMAALIADLTTGRLNSKSLAALGVLAAFAAVLRTISLPAGANLYFFLVILGAYVFGARMGFLLGALSFFLSAIVTGGIGPWLPFQMFASAWMGASIGLVRPAADRAGLGERGQVIVLAAAGAFWGFAFGAITNLWTWPYWVAGPDISYAPGLGFGETLRRYWNFYLLTSLGWDLLRAVCNVAVIVALGGPVLHSLLRFRAKFSWEQWSPEPATPPDAAALPPAGPAVPGLRSADGPQR